MYCRIRGLDKVTGKGNLEGATVRLSDRTTGPKGVVDTHTARPEHHEPGE